MFIKIENEIIALAVNDIKLEVMSSDKKPDSKSKCFLSHSIYVKKLCLEGRKWGYLEGGGGATREQWEW